MTLKRSKNASQPYFWGDFDAFLYGFGEFTAVFGLLGHIKQAKATKWAQFGPKQGFQMCLMQHANAGKSAFLVTKMHFGGNRQLFFFLECLVGRVDFQSRTSATVLFHGKAHWRMGSAQFSHGLPNYILQLASTRRAAHTHPLTT